MSEREKETPKQRAARLMQEVENNPRSSYPKGEVKTILNSIATAKEDVPMPEGGELCVNTEVERVRRGDVFIATMIGGKLRPWVCLSSDGVMVVAVAMSSSGLTPSPQKSRCRFWPESSIGLTVSVFDHDYARKAVSRPYTDKAHLREVEQLLAQAFKLPQRPSPRAKRGAKLRSVV